MAVAMIMLVWCVFLLIGFLMGGWLGLIAVQLILWCLWTAGTAGGRY